MDDPYNMYFLPDGSAAIVVDEGLKRLDLRDPRSMELLYSIEAPTCDGVNHADFAADGSYAVFTCEFSDGGLVKIDLASRAVVGELHFSRPSMPQDIRLSPDGSTFYVADMMNDGVFLVDAKSLAETRFIATGPGAHGLVVSRDGTKLYGSNRGTHNMLGQRHAAGSVSVIDFATKTVVATWVIPGGGSPDMGNVNADGTQLWLSGRYDNEVYVFNTTSGAVTRIPVGAEPHGLTVWPQPGRYSLGHTGNMR